MNGKLHLTYGLVTGVSLSVCLVNHPLYAGLVGGSCIIGSLFPDIDLPNSKLGKYTLGLSTCINKIFGHRGFTHTPFLLGLIWLIYYFVVKTFSMNYFHFWILLGFSVGFLCHIIQDMMTKGGIKFFWPIYGYRIHFTGFESDSKIHIFITLILCVISILYSKNLIDVLFRILS